MRHEGQSSFGQGPMGPDVDHLDHLERVVNLVDMDVEFPAYCYEDTFFSDPEYPVALCCRNEETDGPLHVVLITSFDGLSWWCWIVETKSFEIMELQLEEDD